MGHVAEENGHVWVMAEVAFSGNCGEMWTGRVWRIGGRCVFLCGRMSDDNWLTAGAGRKGGE